MALCIHCAGSIEPTGNRAWGHASSASTDHPATPSDMRTTGDDRRRSRVQDAISQSTGELGDYLLLNQFDPQGRLTPDKLFNDRRK